MWIRYWCQCSIITSLPTNGIEVKWCIVINILDLSSKLIIIIRLNAFGKLNLHLGPEFELILKYSIFSQQAERVVLFILNFQAWQQICLAMKCLVLVEALNSVAKVQESHTSHYKRIPGSVTSKLLE